jgi:NADH-quinone oxidoreductase subunit E
MEQIAVDVTLSANEKSELDHLLEHYPVAAGGSIDALKIIQKYRGWVSDGALKALAAHMGLPLADLESVATFYNLIFRKPVGKVLVHPCNSVSCALMGFNKVHQSLKKCLNITDGQTTPDNQFTLISLPCLAACDKAPVMLVGGTLYENVKPEEVDKILQHEASLQAKSDELSKANDQSTQLREHQ